MAVVFSNSQVTCWLNKQTPHKAETKEIDKSKVTASTTERLRISDSSNVRCCAGYLA
jgi:hypothetical protein